MKLRKVLVSGLIVATLLGQGNVVEAATYNLHYASGAPTSENVTSKTVSLLSTGKDSIIIDSQRYNQYITGSYMSCVGVKYPTVKKNIDYTGTIDLKYTGQTIPKRNVRVNVNLNLNNYTNSMGVTASGNVRA